MELPLHSLRYFCEVADQLHFSKAAAILNISAPSLSQQISKLERTLGVKLFDRSPRHVVLTAAGRQLVPLARRVRDDHDDVIQWAMALQHNVVGGPLRIGMVAAGGGPLTTTILATALQRLASVRIEMRRLGFFDTTRELIAGNVDVVFSPAPIAADDRIIAEPLWSEPRVLVVPESHRLAKRESISITETASEVFVGASGAIPEILDWWMVDPRPDGSHPQRGPVADDFEGLLELVAAGVGVNIASLGASHQYRRDGIAFIPITDIEPATILLSSLKRPQNAEVSRFLALGLELARRA